MKDELYNWFEHEWQATVNQVRIQRHTKLDYTTWWNKFPADAKDTIEVEHVPIMKVEIAEHDLISMIRDLKHHKAHEEVQKRYPQLREAYMNYLSQVYLTVDKMPD
jgi:hypothetical protein